MVTPESLRKSEKNETLSLLHITADFASSFTNFTNAAHIWAASKASAISLAFSRASFNPDFS